MSLYFGATEITKLRDLAPQTGLDITDLWFGETNVYTVWQVYEGTLPATFNANGDDMRQYRIYGNTGGVGDDSGTSYGYKLDMNVKSANLCYKEIAGVNINNVAKISDDSQYNVCLFECTQGETYTIKNEDTVTVYAFFDSEPTNGSQAYDNSRVVINENTASFTAPITGWCATRYIAANTPPMAVAGSVAPEKYEPYSNTTTPIYIGDDPLWAVNTYADCADYQKQKVVRAIKKYVLTGKEDWEQITGNFPSRTYFRWIFAPINYCARHVCTCSHFEQASVTTATTTVGFDVFDSTSVNGEVLAIRPANVQSTTLTDFKAWLAEQYAAGTPVTVWCALTTAEEADSPVPLPALPTCEGATIVDYSGQSAAPEKVLLKYRKEGF